MGDMKFEHGTRGIWSNMHAKPLDLLDSVNRRPKQPSFCPCLAISRDLVLDTGFEPKGFPKTGLSALTWQTPGKTLIGETG
jgi:hypothetical protein